LAQLGVVEHELWLGAFPRAAARLLEKKQPNCFLRTRLSLLFEGANLLVRERQ
jgi:hypothetical protein